MAITSTPTRLVISFICFLPVEPNLDKVAKTQFVLFNQTSSLWCPAQGAPAPFIVWRKNGIMVQNSTSIKYQLTITEENNDKYSCEVKKQDDLDKEEIRLVIESEFFSTNKLSGVSFKRNCGAAGRPNDLFVSSFIGMVRSVHEITRWQLLFQSILLHTFR